MRQKVGFGCLVALALATCSTSSTTSRKEDATPAREDARRPLQCFQVTNPVLTPLGFQDGSETLPVPGRADSPSYCTQELMSHVFKNSYGRPFVGNYNPPDPACAFTRVVLNLTVTSKGRQFDRLGTIWLGNTEIWRTSTAEPNYQPGIAWTHWKDTTMYLTLWKQPQRLIFDLGNIVNNKYTGPFSVTLTAMFIDDGDLKGMGAPPADRIIALSARRAGSGLSSAFTYPEEKAEVTVSPPRNIRRAVVSIAATGQADEEFWWSNVPESGVDTFKGTLLPGKGSFREVRLRIDGEIAGLAWPFPVVFTGGVSPPLHRPVAGPQAFDMREHEIDVTPWAGVLSDGKRHTFSLEVVAADDAAVEMHWVLSGKLFLWLDQPEAITTGCAPKVSLSRPNYEPHEAADPDRLLRYEQTASRALMVRALITRNGETYETSWTQKFSMRNDGSVYAGGRVQNLTATYGYPIAASYRQTEPDGDYSMTLDANLTQTMETTVSGAAVFTHGISSFLPFLRERMAGSAVSTTKIGRAFFWQKDGGRTSGGHGSTRQVYEFYAKKFLRGEKIGLDDGVRLYSRDIAVVNDTTTQDLKWLYLADLPAGHYSGLQAGWDANGTYGVDDFAGRFMGSRLSAAKESQGSRGSRDGAEL